MPILKQGVLIVLHGDQPPSRGRSLGDVGTSVTDANNFKLFISKTISNAELFLCSGQQLKKFSQPVKNIEKNWFVEEWLLPLPRQFLAP